MVMKENNSAFSPTESSRFGGASGLPVEQPALTEAQKGLTERPTMNIRTKIILGFSLLFLFSAGVSITYLMLSISIDKKVKFMETLNNYSFEIQQARRYEKNFFLYRTNLPEALEDIQTARQILKQKAESITAVKKWPPSGNSTTVWT
jgi:hypothetical protein